jgi:WD40 repeat protein
LWTIKTSEPKPIPQLSPDGRLVAAQSQQSVQVWRIDAGEPQLIWEAGRAQFFRFLSDGKHAVYNIPAEEMRLVRAQDGTTVRTIGKGPAQSNFAYHPATDRLAVCGPDGVQVVALGTGELEAELPLGTYEGKILAWHPGGEYLAVWGDDKGITLWNVKQRARVLYVQHFGMPARLCFNEDGSQMASQSLWDRRLCVWDVGTGRRLLEVPEFISAVCDVAPDRRILFLTTRNGGVSLTELTAGACQALAQSLHTPLGHWNKVSLSPESRIAAFSSLKGFELWDVQTTQRLVVREIGPCSAEFDRDGGLFIGCKTGIYHFSRHIDAQSSSVGASLRRDPRSVIRFADAERLTGPITPWTLGVNSSGQTLVFGDKEGWALQHRGNNRKTIRLQTKLDPRLSAVSNDNRFVTVANWNFGGARVWNAESGAYIKDLAVGYCGIMQFSPDGKLLAATPNGVTLWNTSDWRRARELHARGTTPTGLSIAFSPDSRVLAVGQVNGVLTLIDPHTGNEWARLPLWDSGTSAIAFSLDQRWLVASSIKERSLAQVWDLAAMRRELSDRGIDLPGDVLRPLAPSQDLGETFGVVLDDRGILDGSLLPESRNSPAAGDNCP